MDFEFHGSVEMNLESQDCLSKNESGFIDLFRKHTDKDNEMLKLFNKQREEIE